MGYDMDDNQQLIALEKQLEMQKMQDNHAYNHAILTLEASERDRKDERWIFK